MGLRFIDVIRQCVQSRENTRFQHDLWIGSLELKKEYLRLYENVIQKRCKVSDKIQEDGLNWCWKSNPSNIGLNQSFQSLSQAVESICLQLGFDHSTCRIAPNGRYKVSLLRHMIDHKQSLISTQVQITWCKLIPIKVFRFCMESYSGTYTFCYGTHLKEHFD